MHFLSFMVTWMVLMRQLLDHMRMLLVLLPLAQALSMGASSFPISRPRLKLKGRQRQRMLIT
ncbi:hypothetical protein HPP92_001396, partial [Vanilla planifolia]